MLTHGILFVVSLGMSPKGEQKLLWLVKPHDLKLSVCAKPHTEECRTRTGEQMEHDPQGHERLQVHKSRRDVEPEVELDRAPVARENEGEPALLEQQDVEIPLETPGESASVKCGSDAVEML